MALNHDPQIKRLVFGGSFDPPHKGHLEIMRYVLKNQIVKNISVVPAFVSPFKINKPPILAKHRINMLELLIKDISNNTIPCIETLEIDKPAPSYTIDTLNLLKKKYKNDCLGLLLGSDSLVDFSSWKSAREILENFFLVIFRRTNKKKDIQNSISVLQKNLNISFNNKTIILDNAIIDCSSTNIKEQIKSKTKNNCLTNSIEQYIHDNGLY